MSETHKSVLRSAAFAAAVLLWSPASATEVSCTTANLSSFSRLGQVVEDARATTPGKLLAAWLLRSRDADTCRFVFRIDLLLLDGRIQSMNFDAETLEPVDIDDDRDWVDAGNLGVGGEERGNTEPDPGSAAPAATADDDSAKNNGGTGSKSGGRADSPDSPGGGGSGEADEPESR